MFHMQPKAGDREGAQPGELVERLMFLSLLEPIVIRLEKINVKWISIKGGSKRNHTGALQVLLHFSLPNFFF